MTDPQPDRELAEAWQQFTLASNEAIETNMRQLGDAVGQSMEEFAKGLRIVASAAVPDGTLMLLPHRRTARVRRPDGAEAEVGETLDEHARRCVVVRGLGGPHAA